jgi:hypothetical protein
MGPCVVEGEVGRDGDERSAARGETGVRDVRHLRGIRGAMQAQVQALRLRAGSGRSQGQGVRWIAGLAMVTALCLGAAACDEKLSSLTGPTPGLEPTWASIHANIITSTDSSGRSACTQCHTNVGRNPAGRLNLAGDAASAYAALVNRPSSFKAGATLIIPGDPDNSYFVHKLAGASDITGTRMPQSGPPYLTDGQMLVIERWIRNGAANN